MDFDNGSLAINRVFIGFVKGVNKLLTMYDIDIISLSIKPCHIEASHWLFSLFIFFLYFLVKFKRNLEKVKVQSTLIQMNWFTFRVK